MTPKGEGSLDAAFPLLVFVSPSILFLKQSRRDAEKEGAEESVSAVGCAPHTIFL